MKTGIDCIGISTSFYCHDRKGKWLLHRRSINCRDEKGAWDTGGGKLEFGLTLEENVLKEIKEEYGCLAIIQEQLSPITLLRSTPEGIQTHWIIVPFILLVDDIQKKSIKIGDPEKMDELGWFSFDKLPQPLHSGFLKTTKQYKDFFNKYSLT
jgi:8-oxo-dGTP pyrophosphatase MutT (NUDIX family)